MREILFRGKRKTIGGWAYGFLQSNDFVDDWEVIPETVGQYTGLTDKNGKKIFEGDIVKIAHMFDDEEEFEVVQFGEGTFDSGIYRYYGWHTKDKDGIVDHKELYIYDEIDFFEIIGNIHDNPELLKKEENNG